MIWHVHYVEWINSLGNKWGYRAGKTWMTDNTLCKRPLFSCTVRLIEAKLHYRLLYTRFMITRCWCRSIHRSNFIHIALNHSCGCFNALFTIKKEKTNRSLRTKENCSSMKKPRADPDPVGPEPLHHANWPRALHFPRRFILSRWRISSTFFNPARHCCTAFNFHLPTNETY